MYQVHHTGNQSQSDIIGTAIAILSFATIIALNITDYEHRQFVCYLKSLIYIARLSKVS